MDSSALENQSPGDSSKSHGHSSADSFLHTTTVFKLNHLMITVAKSATDHHSTHKTIFIYKHYLWEIEFACKNNWSRDFP